MFNPIAIVGRACLLPGAHSPDQLWDVLRERRIVITPAPASRWRGSRERLLAEGICASDAGGFVRDFQSTPGLHESLDPLFHWLLHVGRRALEDAGMERIDGDVRGGAIVGNLAYPTESLVDMAQSLFVPEADIKQPNRLNRFSAGYPVHLLCRTLGLTAGGYALDAACASSLYAIKIASDWLNSQRADVMLAGAINRVEGLLIHAGFTALRALSPTGSSRPFHRDADGLVPAEGAALLVLKRLADAEKAGDRILGVIRGVGLSNDGRGSGLLTPSAAGQVRAMEAAYAQSGLRPADISLVECHATGTTVGDAVELESMSEVFRGLHDVPIGSLKSNLGHLITVSGAAGIIKVLEGFRHDSRPATLNATPATKALAGTPFRLLCDSEPWETHSNAPRRAAISSFGFGGNNAHLILEEYRPGVHRFVREAARPRRAAVVGLAARLADGESTAAFEFELLAGASRIRTQSDGTLAARAEDVFLPSSGLIFPPRDLERALAQQNLLLEIAAEALEQAGALRADRTSAFIGMTCDAESTRTVLRAVLTDLLAPLGLAKSDLTQREIAMDAGFDAARVIGCMPNIPANRLNRQFAFNGPGFTIAAEELSGIRALEIAIDALAANEIDAALVGAVDLCAEPVHRSAVDVLSPDRNIPGDGACVLILKRVEEAVRDGDSIRAIIDLSDVSEGQAGTAIGKRVRDCFGHVHAASGLLEVAAATVFLDHRVDFDLQGKIVPSLPAATPRGIRLQIESLGGQSSTLSVIESDRQALAPRIPSIATPDIDMFAASDLPGLIRAVGSGQSSNNSEFELQPCRLAIVSSGKDRAERIQQARLFLQRVENGDGNVGNPPEGIFFRRDPVPGELAFVFTGAAAAYSGMGRDLLLALPGLASAGSKAEWVFREAGTFVPGDFERLCGSSFLCQAHAKFTQHVLGLVPRAAIGLSSGETNSLYALGAWRHMQHLLRDIEDCGLYTSVLGGRSDAVHEAWRKHGIVGERFANYWISAPLHEVEAAVRSEKAVHITIVNTATDVVIGGESAACRRVVEKIGLHRSAPLGGEFAAHCPEVEPAAELWRQLHHRPTTPQEGIRFYSNALGRSYDLTADSVADALTGQALKTIDFPRTIQRAWDDGVRIFVEHGPRSQCTQSIRAILGDRPFIAVSLDVASRSSLTQAMYAAAELWTVGVAVDIAGLRALLGLDRHQNNDRKGMFRLPAHPNTPDVLVMTPAPQLAPVVVLSQARSAAAAIAAPGTSDLSALHAQMSVAHQAHLSQVARIDQAYQETQARLLLALAGTGSRPAPPVARTFSRRELEIHASGLVSEVFGPAFKAQDQYRVQVRMPEPPLLLADRVVSLIGEAGSMGVGSITTETDVRPDAWYLHQGRMPAGFAIEAGQADLMLISWLGVDNLNKGTRVYRLLGCDLSFSGGLPRVGETLRYDIHVDSHASHAGIHIFFFHYDCTSAGAVRLTVRNGQAGFFTGEELANSEGVLWSPETGAHTPAEKARLDPPVRVTGRRSFDLEHILAFEDGRPVDCFGSGFEYTFTHTRTPRIQADRMHMLQRVPVFDPEGGPWQRGYLRAEWSVRPDDWFFDGHFKNDPCMPGTLMFEGCLQAMAFYLGALGLTIDHDGWRFEPVPDVVYSLRCRGQVMPSSKLLVYEVFVDEVVGGPMPMLYADVLCTVDGLKAFHCPRLGLRLVPDWPLDALQPVRSANVPFDHESLMACALGRPSNAFGPDFTRFDGLIKVPRLPGDPYHFMSRIVRADEGRTVGAVAEVDYDVPANAWYFSENGYPVMPISVLTEVLLQPCGWLASFAGTWKQVQNDIYFRNLDGGGIVHCEVGPATGTLRTRVTLKSCSEAGSMSITAFDIVCHAGERLVFEGQAVFGHFPAEALKNQAGLPASDAELQWFREEVPHWGGRLDFPLLGQGKLRMIDRVTGYWPGGGAAGLGRMRAEFDVDPRQWFFKAHFFGDPVQPGSLGLEAVVQTLQVWMLATNRHAGMKHPRFEAIATGERTNWTYRGQVLPHNRRVTILLEVVEATPTYAKASASLWVDGAKIYSIPNVATRVVESAAEENLDIEELDPAKDTWLNGHCPTYTIPVLPMMSIVDRLAAAASRSSTRENVIELRDVTLNGWIAFPAGARRLKMETTGLDSENLKVTLSAWREAPHASLSRYDVMATALVQVSDEYPPPPAPFSPLTDALPVPVPYACGELFHGPAFQFLQEVSRSNSGSSFLLDSSKGGVPRGFMDQGLFDGITHGIPNENLRLWSDQIAADQVGYPSRILRFAFFGKPPADGVSRCEVRFRGFHQEDPRFPQFRAQLRSGTGDGRIWAELDLVYVLFPKGPLGNTPAMHRRDFLLHKKYVPGMELGHIEDAATCVKPADLYESDWLPGTIENAFGLQSADKVLELAVKQHIARATHIHPVNIKVMEDGSCALIKRYPLNRFPVRITRTGDSVSVRDGEPVKVDCAQVRKFWRNAYGIGEWPIADLHVGMIERFVRRVELVDPAGFAAIRGKPAVFLANHQVAVESVLFSVLVSALTEVPIKVIAKAEHRRTWIGQLIDLTLRYPDVKGAAPILFFERSDQRALLSALGEYGRNLTQDPASLLVHVDGTRALSSRTPVSQVSSVLLDLALAHNLPVVPVRFIGGLPVQPVAERLEFPFGAGQQDIRIGRAILPDELKELTLAERSKAVLASINQLAPENENSFAPEGASLSVRNALIDSLRFASNRCEASRLLSAAFDGAEVSWPADRKGQWLQEFHAWLSG